MFFCFSEASRREIVSIASQQWKNVDPEEKSVSDTFMGPKLHFVSLFIFNLILYKNFSFNVKED